MPLMKHLAAGAPLLTLKREKRDSSQYYDEPTPVYTAVLSSRTLGAPTDLRF